MAKKIDQIDALVSLASTYTRTNGQPIDDTLVWNSLEGDLGAQAYAQSDMAYVGQIISVNEGGVSTAYIIQEDGTLKTIGQSLKVESSFFESIY